MSSTTTTSTTATKSYVRVDYKVVYKLYYIFTHGDEILDDIRGEYDEMCSEIENQINSFIGEFVEEYDIISKFLEPNQIKILSFYYSELISDELYKISQVLGNKNNNLDRLKLCEYIVDHIYNYI